MFAVLFDLEGQLDCTLHETKAGADLEAARLSEKYAAERASYSASVAVQAVQLPPAYAQAPAMLAALRSIGRDDDGDGMLDAAGMDRIAAILARLDGTPTAQPAETCEACGFMPCATPTDESCDCPTGEAGSVTNFASHCFTIQAAQGYVSDPDQWNAPTPAQVAHLLALSGISHGAIAADPND
jgi:hypothetical protein